MAQTIGKVRERLGEQKGRYGVIGLGSGSLACHSKDGEAWRIFEIDPVIIGIASNPRYFTFLKHCLPKPDIVLGDARLTMAKEPNDSFDLIIVDAFSSDAVPVHLMTAEAIRLYLDKVKPNGIVLLHISNRYLDLNSVLGATIKVDAGRARLHRLRRHAPTAAMRSRPRRWRCSPRAARRSSHSVRLEGVSEFEMADCGPWTDDYSDILGPFLSKMRNRSRIMSPRRCARLRTGL